MTKFNSTMAVNVIDNLTLPGCFKELFKNNFGLLVCFLCLSTLAVICFMLTTLFRTDFRLPSRHVDMRVTDTVLAVDSTMHQCYASLLRYLLGWSEKNFFGNSKKCSLEILANGLKIGKKIDLSQLPPTMGWLLPQKLVAWVKWP